MIEKHYTIPGKPPVFVTLADQDRCRANGQKTISRTNRAYQGPCGVALPDGSLCLFSCRGASNMAQHRRRHGGACPA